MSGASVDAKVAKAFGKVGKKLGWGFKLYRPDVYTYPVSDRNFFKDVTFSWSKDEGFKANPELNLDSFTVYANYKQLLVGDIIASAEMARTFIVYEINPIRGAVAVQCNDRMTVLRPELNPAADVKMSLVEVIKDMPCALSFMGAAGNDGALGTVTSSMSSGQSQIEVWTVIPAAQIRISDTIEINNQRYVITSLDISGAQVKIKAKSTKAGK